MCVFWGGVVSFRILPNAPRQEILECLRLNRPLEVPSLAHRACGLSAILLLRPSFSQNQRAFPCCNNSMRPFAKGCFSNPSLCCLEVPQAPRILAQPTLLFYSTCQPPSWSIQASTSWSYRTLQKSLANALALPSTSFVFRSSSWQHCQTSLQT